MRSGVAPVDPDARVSFLLSYEYKPTAATRPEDEEAVSECVVDLLTAACGDDIDAVRTTGTFTGTPTEIEALSRSLQSTAACVDPVTAAILYLSSLL